MYHGGEQEDPAVMEATAVPRASIEAELPGLRSAAADAPNGVNK